MRVWRARLLALIAALTLLMPATSLAEVLYRCRMTGSIGPKCCCARDHDAGSRDPCEPTVDRPDCCEVQAQPGRSAVSSNPDAPRTVAAAALLTTLTLRELSAPPTLDARFARENARGPPSIGPPRYLENCSLLR